MSTKTAKNAAASSEVVHLERDAAPDQGELAVPEALKPQEPGQENPEQQETRLLAVSRSDSSATAARTLPTP